MKREKRVLVDVTEETHRKFKVEAAKNERSMSSLISEFMEAYAKGNMKSKDEISNGDKKNQSIQNEAQDDLPSKDRIQSKPKKIIYIACPLCEEQINIKGISGHIRLRHGVSNVSIQDLNDVKEGSKSLEELVSEKFKNGGGKVFNIPSEIKEREFTSKK